MEKSTIAIISNVWTLMMYLEKGDIHEGHTHKFDHTHLLTLGKVKVNVDGVDSIFEAPAQILIKKGTRHSIECLSETSVGTCIHAIRNGSRVEDIVDPRMMPSYYEGDIVIDGFELLDETPAVPWAETSQHDNPNVST